MTHHHKKITIFTALIFHKNTVVMNAKNSIVACRWLEIALLSTVTPHRNTILISNFSCQLGEANQNNVGTITVMCLGSQ